MTVATKGLAGSARGLPPLTVATLTMYGAAVVLLVLSAATWEPGKNPRELIVGLTLVAVVFFVFIAVRGPRLTVGQASAMTAVQLGTIGALTWSTDLVLGAFANGTVLPVVGVYVLWFLHPVKGRVLLLAGLTWWFVAVAHHGDPTVTWFALSLVVQTIVAAEVFARIKTRMDRLARTDFLTGTLNRGGIHEVAERELARATRHGEPFAVVVVDLDGLREVNNSLGHRAGDEMLESAARHWRERLRGHDAVGRIGGDEFLFVLPRTSRDEAEEVVQRLVPDSPAQWSAGVAVARPDDTVASLLERADGRLYAHKAARRRG